MTCHVIAKEGMPSIIPDVWLDKGCLWIPEGEYIPVTEGFNWDVGVVVGRASDLQRNEETGEVSVEIELYDEREIDKDLYKCSFWAVELEGRTVPATDEISEHQLYTKARVRGIAIVGIAANPMRSQ